MDIQGRLRTFLVDELQAPESALGDDMPLITSHVIDSLGLLQIVSYLEAEFEIEFSDDEIAPENFETISTITKLVSSKLSTK